MKNRAARIIGRGLRVTNNSLDVAVNGGGLFMTYNPKDDTTAYTRDGHSAE